MRSSATLAPSNDVDTGHRSIEAYVLPRMIDVGPDNPAIVTALLVREHELLARGQPVARVRWPAPSPGRVAPVEAIITAPTPGMVVRCWASPGDRVGPGRGILSMTSSEDVLVVARFERPALPHLWRGAFASVFVGNGARPPTHARIASVTELPDRDSPGEGPIRVILRMPAAPVEALWPGTRATVGVWP